MKEKIADSEQADHRVYKVSDKDSDLFNFFWLEKWLIETAYHEQAHKFLK